MLAIYWDCHSACNTRRYRQFPVFDERSRFRLARLHFFVLYAKFVSQHLLATNTKIGSFRDLEPPYGVDFFAITKKERRGIFPPPYLRLEGKFTLLGGVLFGVSTIRENDPEMHLS